MPKINSSLQFTLNQKTILSLLKEYGLVLKSYKIASTGIENSTSFITTNKGNYVLRVYRQNKKSEQEIKYEVDFMNFLNKSRIPIPQVILNNSKEAISTLTQGKTQWHYLIMQQVTGKHLHHTQSNLIPELAKYQALMHKASARFSVKQKLKPNTLNEGFKYFLGEYQKAKHFINKNPLRIETEKAIGAIIKEFDENKNTLVKLPTGAVHLDYDSDNILVLDNKVTGIIDFDDVSYHPYIEDLANTLWWWLYMNPKKDLQSIINTYLKNYSKYRKLSPRELKFLPFFMKLRNIAVGIILEVNRVRKTTLKEWEQIIKFNSTIDNLKF